MNISAKFQLYPQYIASGELISLNIFWKFGLLVAMPTNQTERLQPTYYVW